MMDKYAALADSVGYPTSLPPNICGYYNTELPCRGPPLCPFGHKCAFCREKHTMIYCIQQQKQK